MTPAERIAKLVNEKLNGNASLLDLCVCGHIRKVHDGEGACDVPKTCACKKFRDKLTHVSLALKTWGVEPGYEKIVPAFACPRCNVLYREPERADACCRCEVCKTKTTGVYQHLNDRCGYCDYEKRIAWAKVAVRQARKECRERERYLRKEMARKRPKKGSPCR